MQTFAVYVDDVPGALNRVVSLMRRLALNVQSLTIAGSESPGVSRMTVVVNADDRGGRFIETNLCKIGMVRHVQNLSMGPESWNTTSNRSPSKWPAQWKMSTT